MTPSEKLSDITFGDINQLLHSLAEPAIEVAAIMTAVSVLSVLATLWMMRRP